jgi:hypothetical protein
MVIEKIKQVQLLGILNDVLAIDNIKQYFSTENALSCAEKISSGKFSSIAKEEIKSFYNEFVFPIAYGDVNNVDAYLVHACKLVLNNLTPQEIQEIYNNNK